VIILPLRPGGTCACFCRCCRTILIFTSDTVRNYDSAVLPKQTLAAAASSSARLKVGATQCWTEQDVIAVHMARLGVPCVFGATHSITGEEIRRQPYRGEDSCGTRQGQDIRPAGE